MKRALVWLAIVVAVFFAAPASCFARTLFSTGFEDGPLHPELEDVDGVFEPPNGVIRRMTPPHDEDRHYIRTVDSDYFAMGPFAFEVSFTNVEGFLGTIQYIGLGNGRPNPFYYNEPGPETGVAGTGTGAVYLRIHSPDIVDGRIDWAFNYGVAGEQILGEAIGYLQTVGWHRARVSATYDAVEVSIDENYTGTFTPTISSTIDLNTYPQIRSMLLAESHAFFGTARSSISYDDFAIVPEPASGAMLLTVVVLACVRRRK